MNMYITWVKNHWQEIVIGALLCRSFVNNLLTNCPFLRANKIMEVIQGIFNALVQTITQQKTVIGIPTPKQNQGVNKSPN